MKKIIILSVLLFVSAFDSNLYTKNGDINVSFMGAFNVPMGAFGEYWESGFGFILSGEYEIVENIRAGLNIAWMEWNSPENEESAAGYSDTYYAYPISAILRYYLNEGSGTIPYLGIDYGLFFLDRTEKNPFYKTTTESTKMGFSGVLGMTMPFGNKMTINSNVKYTTIFDRFDFFSINLGLGVEL